MIRIGVIKAKTPRFDVDSVERIHMENLNRREARKLAYAARLEKQRLKQDRTPDDQGEQEATKQGWPSTH